MMSNSEFLHQGENVDIIREQILVLFFAHVNWRRRVGVVIQKVEFAINFQPGDEMRGLEECSKIAVLGDICQKLQGHEDILITRHGGQHSLGGRSIAITEVQGVRTGGESWGIRVVGGLGGGETQSAIGLCVAGINYATIDGRAACDVESLYLRTALLRGIGDRQVVGCRDVV
jgi:hypothetical protein